MRDALLHIPLYAAYGAIMWLCFWAFPPLAAAAVAGGIIGFIREVTQAQAKHNNDILTGWNVFAWSRKKQAETFIPVSVLLVGALMMGQ
jgi:phosphate/sulfate permease